MAPACAEARHGHRLCCVIYTQRDEGVGVTPVIASIHVGPVQLTNASAYRPLSAFKTQEITHVVKLDTSFGMFISGCARRIACAKEIRV